MLKISIVTVLLLVHEIEDCPPPPPPPPPKPTKELPTIHPTFEDPGVHDYETGADDKSMDNINPALSKYWPKPEGWKDKNSPFQDWQQEKAIDDYEQSIKEKNEEAKQAVTKASFAPLDPNSPLYIADLTPQEATLMMIPDDIDPDFPPDWREGLPSNGNEPPLHANIPNSYGKPDLCFLEPSVGDCQNFQVRWGFNSYTARCQEFFWSGCHGNSNNFPTQAECEQACLMPPKGNCIVNDTVILDYIKWPTTPNTLKESQESSFRRSLSDRRLHRSYYPHFEYRRKASVTQNTTNLSPYINQLLNDLKSTAKKI